MMRPEVFDLLQSITWLRMLLLCVKDPITAETRFSAERRFKADRRFKTEMNDRISQTMGLILYYRLKNRFTFS